MLGLGRALGETIAVVLIISPSFIITRHILQSGANSVASLIALRIGDAHGIAINALMAAGLALFVMTLLRQHDRVGRRRPVPLGQGGGAVSVTDRAAAASRAGPPPPDSTAAEPHRTRRAAGSHRRPGARPHDARVRAVVVRAGLDRLLPADRRHPAAFGFALCWYGAFLLTTWLVVREQEGRLAATDRVVGVAIASMSCVLLFALGEHRRADLPQGHRGLTAGFFTNTMQGTGPLDQATDGGALHSIVGLVEQVGLATLISVPLGITTAVFLNEIGGRLRRPVRMFVDAMSGVPVDRRRPVHLRGLGAAVRLLGLRGGARALDHHAADDHADLRGGAAPRARAGCARRRSRWARPSGARPGTSCCRPRSRVSSPRSSSASPARSATPPR